ncbi:MAG: hypothetical protein WBZ37_31465, partial [Mycobacterium sp.]
RARARPGLTAPDNGERAGAAGTLARASRSTAMFVRIASDQTVPLHEVNDLQRLRRATSTSGLRRSGSSPATRTNNG